ncbi:MAG TPA: hypothetical protein VG649_23170 [Candidatus Angelobacter sp.]|jgi:hypothetical protein|nr:hypothetical protein [Candidatus Angelobacter sp.]
MGQRIEPIAASNFLLMGYPKKRSFLVHSSSAIPENRFQTGRVAPETGIYRVVHNNHRLPHEVVILRGQIFPRCSKCFGSVLFELAHAAPDLFQSGFCRVYELPAIEQESIETCA